MHKIPLQLLQLEEEGFHILVEVTISGVAHNMVVDTGASKTVFDRSTLLQSGIPETSFITSDLLSTGLGTNEMKSETMTLKEFSIQDWICKPTEVAILDLSTINYAYTQMNLPSIIGVLGGDILLNYGGIINYKKRTLTLNRKKRNF
ncbi:aspartyl protease family protein [Sphingobacterium faecale]|uniref:Aspartyl protease family protein n=1 Tax=Sphingobacterium faecale TaxID=2803775 RepID=A0ABS1R0C9_9SPHI|nr:aspartyl protease family protein [Sphingobacterium faecale]MBL1408148.1 aspartyl protease family protein [Sphingobacterium faecale]